MEHNIRVLPADELIGHILELLQQTEPVPLVITGNSMSPFLVHGRDTVYLSNVKRPLKRGDMVLYKRTSGRYVLHRIYKIEGDNLCMVGDAQTQLEHGIMPQQVLAIVTAVKRKGKMNKSGSFWWEFFEKIWIRMIKARPYIIKIYSKIMGKKNKN